MKRCRHVPAQFCWIITKQRGRQHAGGHVLVNGLPAKPSTRVCAGDRVDARIADRDRVVEVVRPIESRVGAQVAAACYVDHSPPVETEAGPGPQVTLIRGEGRPSKRLRRELERLRRAAEP